VQGPNSRYLIFLNERAYAGNAIRGGALEKGVKISATPPRFQSDGRGVSGEPSRENKNTGLLRKGRKARRTSALSLINIGHSWTPLRVLQSRPPTKP